MNEPAQAVLPTTQLGRKAYGWGPKGFATPATPFVSLVLGEDPRAIAEPGRGADPNSVPDLAGDGTRGARGRRYLRT
jgi:hypothetical protein